MKVSKVEYNAVKKYVTQEIADSMCLNDACAEAIFAAYHELYGQTIDCDYEVRDERISRMQTYAIDLLQELNPQIVRDGELACRSFDLFVEVRHDMWAFYDRATDEQPHVVVGWGLGSYSAVEYDLDGDVVRYGTGKTPQDALYAMRLVIDGWED